MHRRSSGFAAEKEIEEWLLGHALINNAVGIDAFKQKVASIFQKYGDGTAYGGRRWMKGFFARRPGLAQRLAENTELARVVAIHPKKAEKKQMKDARREARAAAKLAAATPPVKSAAAKAAGRKRRAGEIAVDDAAEAVVPDNDVPNAPGWTPPEKRICLKPGVEFKRLRMKYAVGKKVVITPVYDAEVFAAVQIRQREVLENALAQLRAKK